MNTLARACTSGENMQTAQTINSTDTARFRRVQEDGDASPNATIAANLSEFADLLERQGAGVFRIRAYRNAAAAIEESDRSLDEVFWSSGADGLAGLPAIGKSIAAAIAEMIMTGRWTQLERLRGATDSEKLFSTIPGIGKKLAAKIHGSLDVDTLEALEAAAHDGRLARVPGMGRRRVELIKGLLAARLGRRRIQKRRHGVHLPPIKDLLDVDTTYRNKAASGELRLIAPKRFNPENKAWLPVLHAMRGDWHYTVLFSNTRLAHALDRTRDWVIVYFHKDQDLEGQCTIVTETRGALRGKRVVRGHEKACELFYGRTASHGGV